MQPRLQRPLLTVSLILALASAVRGDDPTPNPFPIWIDVNFDQQVNDGLPHWKPGPRDLQVTLQMGVADVSSAGVLYGGMSGQSGWSMSTYGQSAPGSSSLSLVIHGVSEDTLGCMVGWGFYINGDPAALMMRGFNFTIANATFPPAPSTCDPMGMMGGMMGGMPGACESLEEGEVSIAPGGEATVWVTVKHQQPGKLTVKSANSDIQVVSGGEHDVGGADCFPVTIRAANTFNGQQELTCSFQHNSGGRVSQDVLIVKSGPPPVLIARIIDTDSDPEGAEDDDTPPLQKYVGNGVTLQALPDPADGMFASAPSWRFTAAPNGSSFQLLAMSGQPFTSGESCSFTPDVEGTYTLTATSGTSSQPIDIDAHPVGILKIVDTDTDPEGEFPDDSEPLVKLAGFPFQLRAIPDPEDKSFYMDVPQWELLNSEGERLMLLGIGEMLQVVLPDPGDYVLRAFTQAGAAKQKAVKVKSYIAFFNRRNAARFEVQMVPFIGNSSKIYPLPGQYVSCTVRLYDKDEKQQYRTTAEMKTVRMDDIKKVSVIAKVKAISNAILVDKNGMPVDQLTVSLGFNSRESGDCNVF